MPAKLLNVENAPLMRQFGLRWLPGLAIVSPRKQRLHHSWLGYLPPALLLDELAFGKAMAAYESRDMPGGIEGWLALVESSPRSERAPEALYWAGVAGYRIAAGKAPEGEQDAAGHVGARPHWSRLVAEYADSSWATKVAIYLED